jgi:prepilin-type N-terminal cleavage/methylation domain-containing protein
MTFNKKSQKGMTLIEMMTVSSLLLVISAAAMPNMMNVIGNALLRGAASSLSGIIQLSRARAIKQNQPMTVFFVALNGGPYAYVKNAASSDTSLTSVDPLCKINETCHVVQLGAPVIQVTVPSGSIPPLDPSVIGFTPLTYPDLPTFNSRGLPCKYTGTGCTNSGFAYYFTDIRTNAGWTAVSISPAGRISRYFWDGSKWAN